MDGIERTGVVKLRGKPVTLLGPGLKAGDPAPEFRAVDGAFRQIQLADFKGKVVLLSAVPSLDTPVCSLQTKRFNDEVARLPTNVVVLTISTDLPFAQKRFCESEKVERILILCDSVWHSFGGNFGVLIKDMGLLARSVFVIAKDGTIAYMEIVPEMGDHPNYSAALVAAREAADR